MVNRLRHLVISANSIFVVPCLTIGVSSFGQTGDTSSEEESASSSEAAEVVPNSQSQSQPTSRVLRQDSTFTAQVIPLSLGTWVPGKRGVSLGWVKSEDTTIDVEYLRGSIGIDFSGLELAQFKEELMTVGCRSFMGTNSFNLRPSLGLRRYTLTAGDRLLAQVTGQTPTERTLFEISTYVAGLSIGNRWQFGSGFTLGVDWLEIVIPVYQKHKSHPLADYVTDPDTQRGADRVGQLLRNAPTFALAKLNAGWTF